MGFSFMRTQKIKTPKMLVAAYRHNYRIDTPENAIANGKGLNNEVISTGGRTYLDVFKDTISRLDYYKTHEFRKNGVMAIEIVMALPKSEQNDIDIEKWKEDNAQWLRETFNANPDKYGDNVISMVYHGDEAGGAHCHAIVIPIDENGKINCSRFLSRKQDYIDIQNSYGRKMEKEHGLTRGMKGSKAKHKDIARFYTELNDAVYGVNPPEMRKGETIDQYQDRVKETFRNMRAASLREKLEKDAEIERTKMEYKDDFTKDSYIISLEKQLKNEQRKTEALVREFGTIHQIKEKCRTMDQLNDAFANFPDKKKREETYDGMLEMLRWANSKREGGKKKHRSKESDIETRYDGEK